MDLKKMTKDELELLSNKDITKDKIDQIMNLGINEMFNKLFDCEYG